MGSYIKGILKSRLVFMLHATKSAVYYGMLNIIDRVINTIQLFNILVLTVTDES